MKPNLLFIVLDTLRADHTSVHGYERNTTPCLESLADDGYAIDQAFAAAPWTPPSHASMFSGVYPTSHGFFDSWMAFNPPHLSLAERLRKAGYSTFGAARNGHIDSEQEVSDGFDEFGDIYRFPKKPQSISDLKSHYWALAPGYANVAYRMISSDRRPSEYVTCEYIRKRILNRETPFFGFININSPHTPYGPPKKFRREFESFDRERVDMDAVKSLSHIDGNGGHQYIAGEIDPTQSTWDAVQDWYDGEVRFADHLVNKLIKTLRETDLYDETMIVVVGDHGEHFGEHDRALHQFSLFDELLHVPLVIKPAKTADNNRNTPEGLVSLVDLYPTILNEFGMSIPESVQGKNVFGPETNDVIFAEYGDPERHISTVEDNISGQLDDEIRKTLDTPLQCARTADHKYIKRNGGDDQYYKITNDAPKESPVSGGGEKLQELIQENLGDDLNTRRRRHTIDEDQRENLQQLGYM